MRRWMGALEWTLEHDRPLIKKKLENDLLSDNLSHHGELDCIRVNEKKRFLRRALLELDNIDRRLCFSRAAKHQSDIQEALARVQDSQSRVRESMDQIKKIISLDWWGIE